ncbi:MAG: hypothetical protein CSB06_01980 [Bacteroidia bacterium]|nr:MAG: hypothetical protein CSB06_01980 [Bacteroidia bacterium]
MMKNRLCMICLLGLVLLAKTSEGQINTGISEHYFGLHCGGVLTSIATQHTSAHFDDFAKIPITPEVQKKGLDAGLAFKYFSEKHFGLLMELNFTGKGGANEFLYDLDEGTSDSALVSYSHDLKSLEMPLMMDIRFGKKHLQLHLYGGMHLAWIFSEQIELLEPDGGRKYPRHSDYTFDGGIDAGVGISYQFSQHYLELGFRYSRGLINSFKAYSINESFYTKNKAYIVGLHYFYRLKKTAQNVKNQKPESRNQRQRNTKRHQLRGKSG